MTQACIVRKIASVAPHPREDRPDLNVMLTEDNIQFVSQKIDMTIQRYQVGDLVVHIPGGSKLPAELQERLGSRDAKIKAGNFAGVRSEGMLMPVSEVKPDAQLGEDVTEILGVTF